MEDYTRFYTILGESSEEFTAFSVGFFGFLHLIGKIP